MSIKSELIHERSDSPRVLLALSRYDHRTHRGVANFAAKHNWHLNCEMAITGNIPHGWQGDGIVSLLTHDNSVVDFVLETGVPFVDLSILREDIMAPRVTADNHMIGKTAAHYYLAKGYKHFAFFSTTDDKVASERKVGFFSAIESKALSISDWTMRNTQGSWADKSMKLVQHLKNTSTPTAIMATRDLDASIVLEACINNNIQVPEQVAILGVDNNDLIANSLQVPLSSINHNVERLGYEGAKLLQRILTGESIQSSNQKIVPSGVTSRRSTDNLAVNDAVVRVALSEMLNNLSNRYYCVESASDTCGITRRTLDAKFRQEFGHTAHTELLNIRMRFAKNELIKSVIPLYEIASLCGFNSAQYFNHFFKRQFGMTPLAFRKQHLSFDG
ncbi:AraC family transcriptional regulator [Thalassotalea sp. PLHSN55]|uniref:AraC family transcriptional regulator n=1 Tax=Thalassotalea sp. PLHSN55 TaxID=3435888 RepID=UPI003F824E8A